MINSAVQFVFLCIWDLLVHRIRRQKNQVVELKTFRSQQWALTVAKAERSSQSRNF